MDLDARIAQIEQRLVAREDALRRGVDAALHRARAAWRPWRRAVPAAALALAVGGLAWWWHRRGLPGRASVAAAAHDTPPAGNAPEGGAAWVRLVPLLWPMLPAAWRSRVSPAMAGSVAAVGLPLLEALLHGPARPPPATMPAVDLPRFAGRWFVVARLPRRFGRPAAAPSLPTVDYALRADGAIDVAWGDARDDASTPHRGEMQRAQVLPGSGGARWMLSRAPAWLQALPQAWVGHWILHVDTDCADYGEALVGSADRSRLMLLSRTPRLPAPRLAALMQLARERGYAVERVELAAGAP